MLFSMPSAMASLNESGSTSKGGAVRVAGATAGALGSGTVCAPTDTGDAQISIPTTTSASRMRPSHERVAHGSAHGSTTPPAFGGRDRAHSR